MTERFVTLTECRAHQRAYKIRVTMIGVAASIFVTIAGWAITQAWMARTEASTVNHTLEVHTARQDVVDKDIATGISRVESQIDRMSKEVRELRDAVLTNKRP